MLIDINKACDWIYNNFLDYCNDPIGCRYDDFTEDFRKAMGAVIKENLTTELTWQDVKRLREVGMDVADYNSYHNIPIGDEAFYREVLKRYQDQEQKNRKK